jgi:hypothetical protein
MYEQTKDLSPEDFLAFIAKEAAKATRTDAASEPSSRRPAA